MGKLIGMIAIIGVILGGIVGWVMNIIALIHSLGGNINAMFVARCIGIFVAPFGAILGYF